MANKRYRVMFYNTLYGEWGVVDPDAQFDNLYEARERRNVLNAVLSKTLVAVGDHYSVLDTTIKYPFGLPID